MQMSKPLKGTVPIITALAMNFCTVRWVTQCACIRSSGSVLKTSFPLLSWFLSHHDTKLYSLTEAYQSLLNPSHIVISQRKSHVNMTSELATVSRRSYPRMQKGGADLISAFHPQPAATSLHPPHLDSVNINSLFHSWHSPATPLRGDYNIINVILMHFVHPPTVATSLANKHAQTCTQK